MHLQKVSTKIIDYNILFTTGTDEIFLLLNHFRTMSIFYKCAVRGPHLTHGLTQLAHIYKMFMNILNTVERPSINQAFKEGK